MKIISKPSTIYGSIFGVVLIIFITLMNASESPEKLIIGSWNELEWDYEKVNIADWDKRKSEPLFDLESEIGQHLLIHEAETWTFLPNGKLKLKGTNGEKIVEWSIKGRGNILQLKYDKDIKENYNMTRLSNNRMVLNFESDIQARGIAKLTFEKVNL